MSIEAYIINQMHWSLSTLGPPLGTPKTKRSPV